MNRKSLLIFLCGALLGSFATSLYLKKQLEEELDKTLTDINREMAKDAADRQAKFSKRMRTGLEKAEILKEPTEGKVLVMNKDIYKKVARSYNRPFEDAEEYTKYEELSKNKPNSDPYVISFEEFCEGASHHDKLTITFYKGDDTLVDDGEEIVDDPTGLIGVDALNRFGETSDDPDVVYVRNEKLTIDYEVVRVEATYQETMGMDME